MDEGWIDPRLSAFSPSSHSSANRHPLNNLACVSVVGGRMDSRKVETGSLGPSLRDPF
jgi:hypothetical protein